MAELKNNYYQSVYDVTSLIPKGRVSTYGAIADYLSLGSARMVGWALNQVHTQRISTNQKRKPGYQDLIPYIDWIDRQAVY